jgi:hypothetical protein
MATEPGNEERLRAAGVIFRSEPLEPPYQGFIDGLTQDQVDVIIQLKGRLDEVDREYGWDPNSAFSGLSSNGIGF